MTDRMIFSCSNPDCPVSTILIECWDIQTVGQVYCDCTCVMDYEGIE